MPRHVHPSPFIVRPPEDLVRKQPDLRRMASKLAGKYATGTIVVTEEDLQIMGRALWDVLNLQNEFDNAHGRAGAAILPIIIESSAADVQALPWETLYHPTHGFLGKHPGFTLTRRVGAPQDSVFQLDKGPLRVLLFTSLPDDVDPEKGRLNVEEEQIQVQEALLPWISKGLVELEMPDDGRFSTLKEMLDSFQPHILFLSGHGRFHYEPHTGEAPYGEFLFESESGDSNPIKEDEVAKALIGTGVQVVVVSACESSKTASDALNNGLTQHISAQGIPHVIGMRESILDMAGIQFARALCDELAQREPVDWALQAARIAIQTPLKGISRHEAELNIEAEISLGQWCLPMLLSPDPSKQIIDWDFRPNEIQASYFGKSLSSISLPARFVGRRAEMRQYKSDLLKGKTQKLLITGPGGQGKTTLAGKLALDLQARGYRVFAWSARPENPWRIFEFDMETSLEGVYAQSYDRMRPRFESDKEHAEFLLNLLIQQLQGRVVFLFDNLESIQNPDNLTLQDKHTAAWIQAALSIPDLILLATSRWQLPDWDGEHLMLSRANYGDFLQMAQQLALRGQLEMKFLEKRTQLGHVYEVLGGNSRGLEFFAAATLNMESDEEDEFLNRLTQTKSELQTNMAIEAIYTRLSENARTFLARLPAHQEPVPAEGMIKLGLDLPEDAQPLLERLLAVSLLEAQYEPDWDVNQYQCAPMVTDWMREQTLIDEDPRWLDVVADYHVYLRENERYTLSQSIITHNALRRAQRGAEADRITLDYIVGPFTRAGFYLTLLTEWLPTICNSEDLHVRGEALGQTGEINRHIGNYETALSYLKQSLAIRQQIGDKAGEGTTLNNISLVFKAQGDYETALSYLQKSLAISQQIGNKAGEGTTLNNISQIFNVQGDYEAALAYLKQSLAIFQQIGDKAGEGTTLGNIANIYHAQGDYETALTYLKQSLAIRQQIGDKDGEGTTLNNISLVFKAQGDYETALSYLQKSLAISQQIGNKAGEGTTLNNISQIFNVQGDYETALSYVKQALAICQQIGDKAGEGWALNNISGIYSAQGDYGTAHSYLKQALAIQQQIGDKAGEGTTLNNISQIYHAQGDYETALSYLKQSLTIQQQIGNKAGEGLALNNISVILQAQGDYEAALSCLKQSLVISQQIGDKAGLCITLFNMGHIHLQNKQLQEALNAWVASYIIAKQIGHAQVLQWLAEFALEVGMSEGLEGWETLAKRMQGGAGEA